MSKSVKTWGKHNFVICSENTYICNTLKNTIMRFFKFSQIAILLILFSIKLIAQIPPTTQEIFNFNIGDEFQYSADNNNGPPEGEKSIIIGKYYSINSDTLYYIFDNHNYVSSFNPNPEPHLEYTFHNNIDTIPYIYLDSSVFYYLKMCYLNTPNPYFSNYNLDTTTTNCQNETHNFYIATSNFEPDVYSVHLVKRLGYTYYSFYSSSAIPIIDISSRLIYYKKGDTICGTPDPVFLSIDKHHNNSSFKVFPNPTNDMAYLELPDNDEYLIEVFDLTFKNIFRKKIHSNKFSLDVSNYSNGIYILKLYNKNKSYYTRLIVN